MRAIYVVIMFILLFCSVGAAQDADMIEQRTKIERLINERMKTIIATSLDRSAFDVGVSVQLTQIDDKPAPLPEPQEGTGEIKPLDDLQLGLLNAEELIRNYEKEIRALKIAKEEAAKQAQKKPVTYQIRQVHVMVGLQEDLGPEYQKQFQTWLSARVKTEFGRIGKASVSLIKPKPKKVEPPKVKTPLDYAKDFQFTIASLLGVLGLLLAVVIFKVLRGPESDDTKRLQLQIAQANLALTEGTKKEPEPPRKTDIATLADLKGTKDLMAKLVTLLMRSDLDPSRVVAFWLENGGDGLFKTAVLFDALMSQGALQEPDSHEIVEALRSIEIPNSQKKPVADTLLQMKDLSSERKIAYLESAYWDLLSFQTIGEQFLRRPFGYFNGLDPREVRAVLVSQPTQIRSVALLSLPPPVQSKVIADLGPDLRKELIEQTLLLPEIPFSEIDAISEALKHQLQDSQGAGKKDEKFSGLVLLPTLLASFSPVEEIACLAELARTKPVQIDALKGEWPTIAFLDQWTPEAAKRFTSVCTNEELEAIVSVLPASKDRVLAAVSGRVREILQDSIRLNSKISAENLNARLGSARKKLEELLTKKDLSLDQLYVAREPSTPGLRVA